MKGRAELFGLVAHEFNTKFLAGAKAFVGLDRIAGDADYLGVQSLELRHGSRKVARLHRTGRRVVLRVEIKHHPAAALGLQIKVACRGGAFDVDDGFSDLKHCQFSKSQNF